MTATPKYQVEKGLYGAWEVASLIDGHVVRTWQDEALAIAECRELNRLAGEWTEADSAAWRAYRDDVATTAVLPAYEPMAVVVEGGLR